MMDLTSDLAIEGRSIETGNGGDPVPELHQAIPGLFGGVTNSGQEADASDYNSTGNNVLLNWYPPRTHR